jgi:hypothetical protein
MQLLLLCIEVQTSGAEQVQVLFYWLEPIQMQKYSA